MKTVSLIILTSMFLILGSGSTGPQLKDGENSKTKCMESRGGTECSYLLCSLNYCRKDFIEYEPLTGDSITGPKDTIAEITGPDSGNVQKKDHGRKKGLIYLLFKLIFMAFEM